MLLVLPVPLRQTVDGLEFEEQACNGALRWSENFSHVTIACPLIAEAQTRNDRTTTWKSVRELDGGRISFVPLAWGYGLKAFTTNCFGMCKRLSRLIDAHEHLQFAIGGLIGDWAAVAAWLAARKRRRFAIHTDRVEHEVLLEITRTVSGLRRLKIRLVAWAMQRYHRHLIERCSLGLWHGNDCFRAYSPWCHESHLIHDIHLKAASAISEPSLACKLADVQVSPVLEICYMGRMDPMKAPLEWLRAVAFARDRGAAIHATWYGDGVLREEVKNTIEELGLHGIVDTPGFIRDREELMKAVEKAHLTLFTHVTRESPRCLLESLVAGTPIVGYESAFAIDLVDGHGGGNFVPIHEWKSLAERLVILAADRSQVASLIADAASNGSRFNDEMVFRRRSELIRKFA